MLCSGCLPLCGNQALSQLSPLSHDGALEPILFRVALAAGGTGGQVPIAGDVHPIVATLASSFCSVCFGHGADTVPDPPPHFPQHLTPPFFALFFILVAVALPATLAGRHSGANV